MRFARRLYLGAGIYGLAVLVPHFFLEDRVGVDYPPAITHPEFYYGFLSVAAAWQILYLFLANDPIRYRPMMIPTVLAKGAFGISTLILFFQQRVVPLVLGFGVVDLVFAALFLTAYVKTGQGD